MNHLERDGFSFKLATEKITEWIRETICDRGNIVVGKGKGVRSNNFRSPSSHSDGCLKDTAKPEKRQTENPKIRVTENPKIRGTEKNLRGTEKMLKRRENRHGA